MRPGLVVGALAVVGALSATAHAAQQGAVRRDPVASTVRQVPPPVVAAPSEVPAPSAARRAGADPAWVRRTAGRAGIPVPALTAYAGAALAAPPDCHLGWTTLAGIGWVESQHGTIGGRTLAADGRSSEPILGPALDGGAFAAIPATPESAALHGDPDWDHALGPMQFIPSTWQTWSRDGDGDGAADPHDLDDAAAAAAAYLCASGDLGTGAGWSAGVFSYNHSAEYVARVHAAASAYAARVG